MADDAQDRTELPSQRRRDDARKQGQVAYSPDLTGSAVLLAGVIGLRVMGPGMGTAFLLLLRERFGQKIPDELDANQVIELANGMLAVFLREVTPFMLLLTVVGVAASVVQVGFYFTPERLEANFDRINPGSGLSKLFSLANLVKGGLALARVAVLAVVVWIVLRARVGVFAAVSQGDVASASALAWELAMRVALYLAIVFFVIGVVDFTYQRYRFEQSLRMTKQEAKEEYKREEGDPLIKARMRQMARDMARRRMLAEVPKATVVITNPTHYAVALLYEPGKMKAPRVTAKGAGAFARRMTEAAREAGVPVLERPPLTRVLYRHVEPGRDIPSALFAAAAEVIAFVYQLKNPRG